MLTFLICNSNSIYKGSVYEVMYDCEEESNEVDTLVEEYQDGKVKFTDIKAVHPQGYVINI
jgi:hypothetical protein